MRKLFLVSIMLISLLPIASYATVDYLAVNHITKEYYWGDDDNGTGWIGWEYIPDGLYETTEADFIKSGYTRTHYPYKIESIIVLAVGALLIGLFIIRKNNNKLLTTTE
jgi:hypothetical protein